MKTLVNAFDGRENAKAKDVVFLYFLLLLLFVRKQERKKKCIKIILGVGLGYQCYY